MATALLSVGATPAVVCSLFGAAAAVVTVLWVRLRTLRTALANAQQLLTHNQARLSLALDGADEALWDWDVAQNRTHYSDRWSRMLGYSPDEIGESVEIFERLVHPGDFAGAMEKLRAHVEGQCESYRAEFRMKAKDGGWRWIRARGRVVARAADGSPLRVAGTHLDITANRQTEEALALERNLLRTLIDNLPDPIYIKDLESGFLVINRTQAKMLHVENPSEALGRKDSDFYPENLAARFRADDLKVMQGGEALVGREEQGLDPNGDPIWLLTTKAPFRDADGKVIGLVGSGRDITELRRAREAAEAAARAKSEFLANMSHEIRTPMNGVIGMTGLLLETDLTPEQWEYTEIVRKSAEALLTVINDILDFSKAEAGKLEIESHAFDLRQVLEEVLEMAAPKDGGRDLDLILKYPAGVPHRLVGDAGRLRQVVTNLVGNAVKFTPQGHVLVAVSCQDRSPVAARMRISVEDTGIGIPADKIGTLFEQFTQVDSSLTRRYAGTGLGLAISKQLIGLMGGSIAVESRPGVGSKFWFELPLPLDPEPEADVAPTAELPEARVLVVDDDDVNRRVLHEQIVGWGMRCRGCASGEQALGTLRAAQLEGDPYEVAFIDHHMPEMDGAALAAIVKGDALLRDTRLVMLTSMGHSSDRANRTGSDGFLVKPVRQSHLLQALTAAIATGRGARSEPPRTAAPHVPGAVPVAANAVNGRAIRVLVAEDNTVNQKVAIRMLEKLGLRADVAANGREVLELLATRPYDVILMDCQMPEMDGYAATAEIRRKEPADHRTIIVALTAEAMAGARERCLDSGMDDYITKPVKLRDLAQVLEKVLKAPLVGWEEGLQESARETLRLATI